MESIESSKYPGFYTIPGFSHYVVSPIGRVINVKSETELSGSTNPDGYHNFRLTGDDGHVLTWGRHRLLGYVFKNPGMEIKGRVVNHLDGVKGKDVLDNLEWTSYQGNAYHAGLNGLTEKCVPISVRDIDTGMVKYYPSMMSCADELGLTKDAISYRVEAGPVRVFPERKQYRKGHNEENWPIPENIHTSLLENGRRSGVFCRNVLTGEVSFFEQQNHLATLLGVSAAAISTWLELPNQPVLPGLVQIKRFNDPTPWREVRDPYLEHEAFTGYKSVVVVHGPTNSQKVFLSAKQCADEMGLKPTALNHRLKSKGAKFFQDDCSYCYYSDLVP